MPQKGARALVVGSSATLTLGLFQRSPSSASDRRQSPDLNVENQSRKTLAGSVRVARHAGKKQAARAATVVTTSADPNARGSRGLTLYKRFPSNRVNPSDAAAPSNTPPPVKAKPRDSTSRKRLHAPAPSAMRSPSSRRLCDTAYDITPYSPMAASSSANPPKTPTKITATFCCDVERSSCSCRG